MVNDKIKKINLFIDGVASVCNDINVIAEKTQNSLRNNLPKSFANAIYQKVCRVLKLNVPKEVD